MRNFYQAVLEIYFLKSVEKERLRENKFFN